MKRIAILAFGSLATALLSPALAQGRESFAHGMVFRAGADPSGPDTIKLAYVIQGQEHLCDILPPGTPHGNALDDLISRLNVPVQSVRAYKGVDLIEERALRARGG